MNQPTPGKPPKPLTLVIGPEDFLAERAVRGLVTMARDAAGGGELDIRETPGAELGPGRLAALTTPSLFEEAAVVIVRNLQDAPETVSGEIAAFLTDPPAGCVIVLVHSGVAKGKRVLEAIRKSGPRFFDEISCKEVKTRRDKLAFAKTEMRQLGRKATDESLDTLLEAVGGDLRTLASSVSQLAADTTGSITPEMVLRYYRGRAEVSGFVVADRVLEGRTADALEQLRWSLQSGTDPVPLLAALTSGLRNVVAVASAPRGMSSMDIARHAGLPPWKVDVIRRQVSGWTPEGISAGFATLAQADADIKGAGADPVYALERAVVRLSSGRAG